MTKCHKANFVSINLLLAASAFNLKKWMNIYFYGLFSKDFTLVLESVSQIRKSLKLIQILLVIKNYF